MDWPFEDARNNLDELLDQVERGGPQTVQYGDKHVVFMTERRYQYERRKNALARMQEDDHGVESGRGQEQV